MFTAITNALTEVFSWVGAVIQSLLTAASGSDPAGALNPLLPVFAITIAVSAFLLGIKVIRKLTWGA